MIIILKEADFSENNIGQIEIPVEFSELTKSVIAKYSNINSGVKVKLNTMLNTLNTAGIYSKLKVLYIPILASNLNECFIELINNYQVDDATKLSAYTYNSDGVSRTGGFSSRTAGANSPAYIQVDSFNASSLSMFAYRASVPANQAEQFSQDSTFISGVIGFGNTALNEISPSHFPVGKFGSTAAVMASTSSATAAVAGLVVTTDDGTTGKVFVNGNVEATGSHSDNANVNNKMMIPLDSGSKNGTDIIPHWGIFGVASYLTDSEVGILTNAINTFMS